MKKRSMAVATTFRIIKLMVFLAVIAALISLGKHAYSFGYGVFAEETVSEPTGEKGGGNHRRRNFGFGFG